MRRERERERERGRAREGAGEEGRGRKGEKWPRGRESAECLVRGVSRAGFE